MQVLFSDVLMLKNCPACPLPKSVERPMNLAIGSGKEDVSMIRIEFFHDVICSFCFPMSARMRRIAQRHRDIEVVHRSFALGWDPEDFIRSFGSREAVKPVVLEHWHQANLNDDEHRFNIEGMRRTDFSFPLSRPGLNAAKAAGMIAGESMYWDVFDRIQHKLFVENRNIEDPLVLEEAVKETSICLADWKRQLEKTETERAVLADLQLAREYGVHSVPALVIDRKYYVSGALPEEDIEQVLARISGEKGLASEESSDAGTADPTGACILMEDKWQCR